MAPESVGEADEGAGIRFERRFSSADIAPFDAVDWETRNAEIRDASGEAVFRLSAVEVPEFWSQSATNVVASKYLRGGSASKSETSVRQLITRVTEKITRWGWEDGYFRSREDGAIFHDELTHLLVQQMASFNSPVWFNVGVEERPQCSACFINSVTDDMVSILDLAKTEGLLFKYGSGTGSNLSTLRSSREALSGGGQASGPVSFMRGFDAFAGVIKSGGRTRRAAKMVILDIDHPDIVEFIRSKDSEERKAWALIEAGYDGDFDAEGGAYDSVFFQNANHSVRVSDDFMRAVEDGADWSTTAVTDGRPMDSFGARDLLTMIAEAAWTCGDPGLQFDSTINRWNTCSATARINASNPCSEFMFLDDTACNLASLNLLRFYDPEEHAFDVDGFRHACEILITAQEILVDRARYPTARIDENSRRFRPLGLGFANLGALIMAWGLPYDSAAGRDLAAAITALMTGAAYAQSARLAAVKGAFPGFERNRRPMLRVIGKHREALAAVDPMHVPLALLRAARVVWDQAVALGRERGYRNSQVTVLAPTGTIAFMMDCDTTGIEPELALVKFKKLVGGGTMKIVNRAVPLAMRRLGYDAEQVESVVEYVREHSTIEGAPELEQEHLVVFDCAFRPAEGCRSIHYDGHIKMMAAVQPFLSGAISKTVNLAAETTPQEIFDLYLGGWRLGLKSLAVYRDGCKRSQPLSTSDGARIAEGEWKPVRRKLPDERQALTHKFSVSGHEGYVTVGAYEDGRPGEIFIVMAKEGSTISGLMDAFATSVSIALQHGVPLKTLVDKFSHTRFEPAGFTNNPQIPIAKSITDYIFRWLAAKFLSDEEQQAAGVLVDRVAEQASSMAGEKDASHPESSSLLFLNQQDAPTCQECGSIMVRSGTCYRCFNCGSTTGCG